MKKIILLFILISSYAFSQSVNDYQYVIVPVKFDFLKSDDKYGLNTLTKLMLQKYGFKAYLSNEEIPLNIERCSFLYANVLENNGMFITKVKVVLKDCQEKVIFETQFGESREKEYAVAYNLALRETSKSFDKLNYQYQPSEKKLGKIGEPAEVKVSPEIIKGHETVIPTGDTSKTPVSNQLYAQPIANGFQVIDTTPKIILRLFNTSQKNVFIAEKEAIKGAVIFVNGQWFFEYYENGKLVSEQLNLKF